MFKYRLAVPGPTPLPPEVVAAATIPMEDERTHSYAAVFNRVLDNLKRTLLTRNDLLLFASSMTGAFEGAVQNLFSPGDRVLVVNNGAFGQRWVELATTFGLDVVEVAEQWGRPVDMRRVAEAVAAHPDLVAAIAVHCETSTATVNDMRAFGQATRGIVSVVDTASGVGACELRTDEWGLDVVVAGCQKALMTPPGLAFASISPRAWALHERAALPRYYFDWDRTRDALRADIARTPWTPAVSLINQLDVALRRLHHEGIENVFVRHVQLGRMVRAGVLGMGLELLSADDDRNAAVTAVTLPAAIDARVLVDHLLDQYGVQIVDSGGPLAARVVRLGHCGYVDLLDAVALLSAFGLALRDLGCAADVGGGVAAALAVAAAHREEARRAPALTAQLRPHDRADRADAYELVRSPS
ncbi:alanine--glyoxylate aminotransferase family protein [Catellatospora sp. KI3]|uniref:pyridoxal-phosphate-dependent aminotransferase family protein n=1 Tax=Catellatospora sp. KI3 TaxID=3041620 RepID=UPI0024828014|nr:alanine--glyoxylate aminotransferase family protein [Catellatospora sp. KI3]MDI1460726.1 alanine--glyoxylate aminotransferase family protein [Catellatospora sp. KI3]